MKYLTLLAMLALTACGGGGNTPAPKIFDGKGLEAVGCTTEVVAGVLPGVNIDCGAGSVFIPFGINGQDGINGADGTDGQDGTNGTNGVSCTLTDDPANNRVALDCGGTIIYVNHGTDGANGNDGANGADGADGDDSNFSNPLPSSATLISTDDPVFSDSSLFPGVEFKLNVHTNNTVDVCSYNSATGDALNGFSGSVSTGGAAVACMHGFSVNPSQMGNSAIGLAERSTEEWLTLVYVQNDDDGNPLNLHVINSVVTHESENRPSAYSSGNGSSVAIPGHIGEISSIAIDGMDIYLKTDKGYFWITLYTSSLYNNVKLNFDGNLSFIGYNE